MFLCSSCTGLSSVAHSAGVNASARNAEKRGRQRDRQRELPVDRADAAALHRARDEHRHQHDRDRDDGAADLAHRLARRVLRRQAFLAHDAFDVLDHDDRIVDDDADRQHHAEQADSWLIVKPTAHMPRKPPISATGITSVAMIVARKFCRNISITRNTSTIASISVLTTSSIEIVMKSRGVVRHEPGHARREARLQSRSAWPSPPWRRRARSRR